MKPEEKRRRKKIQKSVKVEPTKKGHWLCGSTDSREIERVTNAMLGTSSGEFD